MADYPLQDYRGDPQYGGNDSELLNTIRAMKQKRAFEEARAARQNSSPVPQEGTPPWRVDPKKTQLWSTFAETGKPVDEWPDWAQPDPGSADEMNAAHLIAHTYKSRGYDAGIANFLNEPTLGLIPPIADRAEAGQAEFPDQSAVGQGLGMAAGFAFDPLGYGVGMAGGKLGSMAMRRAMQPSRMQSAGEITDRVGSEVTSLADLVKGGDDDLSRLIQGYNDTVGPRNDAISALDSARTGRKATNQSLIDQQALTGQDSALNRAMHGENQDADLYARRRNAISESADDEVIDINSRMADRQRERGKAEDYFRQADRLSLGEMQGMGIGNNDFVQGHLDDIRNNLATEKMGQYAGGVATGVGVDAAMDQDGYDLGDLASSVAGSATGVGLDRMMSKKDEAARLLDSAGNKTPYIKGGPRSTTIKGGDQTIDLRDLAGPKGKAKGGKGGAGGSEGAGGAGEPPMSPAGGLALDPETSATLDGILDRAASDASLKKGEYRLGGGKGYTGVLEEAGLPDTPEMRKIVQRKVAQKRKELRDRRSSVRSTVGDNIGDMVGKGAAYLQGKWRKAGLSDPQQRMIDLDAQVAEMGDRLPKGMTPEAKAEWRSTVRAQLMRELGLSSE
ncbi:MAG: hypothetical protein IPO08_22060 [Xanthomonadales bacterium]|nr:hypothetical protein [Xanthomonadales bacterium]